MREPLDILPRTGEDDDGPSAAERIARAEAALHGMRAQFMQWVVRDLAEMQACLARADAQPGADAAEREAIRAIAHNLKGQCGTFGFCDLGHAAAELHALVNSPHASALAVRAKVLALHDIFKSESA